MPPRHKTRTTQAESGATGDISAIAWNEDHDAPPILAHAFVIAGVGPITMTNMPAAVTEQGGVTRRTIYDFTHVNEIRLVGSVSTVSAVGEMRVQYSADGGTTWRYFDAAQSGPAFGLATAGVRAGGWVTLEANAKGDRQVRLVSVNGDGVVDPVLALLLVQVR